ncbi:hypothetical protein [Streptomyces sp. NPDC057686]
MHRHEPQTPGPGSATVFSTSLAAAGAVGPGEAAGLGGFAQSTGAVV